MFVILIDILSSGFFYFVGCLLYVWTIGLKSMKHESTFHEHETIIYQKYCRFQSTGETTTPAPFRWSQVGFDRSRAPL